MDAEVAQATNVTRGMDHVLGTVAGLWRWPVKSMAGEPVDALRVDHRGAGGDRTHAVLHEHKGARKPLTAREAPRLLAWHAAYPLDGTLDPAQPPLATVTAPGVPPTHTGSPSPTRAASTHHWAIPAYEVQIFWPLMM